MRQVPVLPLISLLCKEMAEVFSAPAFPEWGCGIKAGGGGWGGPEPMLCLNAFSAQPCLEILSLAIHLLNEGKLSHVLEFALKCECSWK